MKTIRVLGRDFTVTSKEATGDPKRYTLTGKRGASYWTMRNAHTPSLMFLLNGGKPLDVWLTDKDGELRVVKG